ncbi:MAG: glycosyltransferase family 39 protein [Ardenticatenaceae bacterium]|nr:glycosyltransferase family 39 protein [Ardenticatenaceae bacterium]
MSWRKLQNKSVLARFPLDFSTTNVKWANPLITRANIRAEKLESAAIWPYVLLASITVLAAALRFYKLGIWSFWQDELSSVMGVRDGFNEDIIRQSLSLTLIRMTVAFLGTSEWNARLVPALIGIITIPALYFPTRKMFGSTIALVSILLLAVSPWHLYWSQNARFYSFLLLLYALALFAFYFGIEEDRPQYLLISLFLLGLAARERLLVLFFIPVVLSYLVLLRVLPFEKPAGFRVRNMSIFFLPAFILALFFTFPYLRSVSGWMIGFGRVNNNPLWLLSGVVYYVRIPIMVMAAMGTIYLLARKDRVALFLSLSAMIPFLTIMVLSMFQYTANRYIFISLPSWIILASLAAVEIFRKSQENTRILAVGVLVFLVLDPLGEDVLYYQYQNGNRDNWKAAFALVRQQKKEGELVVSNSRLLANYYMREKTETMEEFDLSRVKETQERIWFVEDMTVASLRPDMHRWIQKNAQLVANLDVHVHARNFEMRVYSYDPSVPRRWAAPNPLQ